MPYVPPASSGGGVSDGDKGDITVMQTAGVLASNAALTPVTSVQLGINRIYVETDY